MQSRFNPRAPCGARLRSLTKICSTPCFNPRAPCGARHRMSGEVSSISKFQSTRPVWGATCLEEIAKAGAYVSIHAPRVGRDCFVIFLIS